MGYAIGPAALLKKMIVCKQGEDVHTGIWAQMIAAEFMSGTDYEAHLDKLRAIYRQKARLMTGLIEKHLVPHGIAYHPIQGGLFIWCELPEGADMRAFCTRAVKEHKVAVVPGNAFLVNEQDPCQAFRLNFSTPTDEAIVEGCKRLGRLTHALYD